MSLSSIELSILEDVKREATKFVVLHGRLRTNKAPASERTIDITREVAHAALERLWTQLSFKIRSLSAIDEKHVEALIRSWHDDGHKPKTMQNNVSRLRQILKWAGKGNIIPRRNGAAHFLPEIDRSELKVRTVADRSKSWSENGVDVPLKIKEAMGLDRTFGCMLLIGVAFGLRRKEQIRIEPWKADGGTHLLLNSNITKSGKDRAVDVHDEFQRSALNYAKSIVKKGNRLGWNDRSLKQCEQHYNYMLRKIGITGESSDCVGHGLRAEYAENQAMLLGLLPGTLGGKSGQMPADNVTQIQLKVSTLMGHHRPEVTGAYYGSTRLKPATVSTSGAVLEHRGVMAREEIGDHPDLIVAYFYRNGVEMAVQAETRALLRLAFQQAVDQLVGIAAAETLAARAHSS